MNTTVAVLTLLAGDGCRAYNIDGIIGLQCIYNHAVACRRANSEPIFTDLYSKFVTLLRCEANM